MLLNGRFSRLCCRSLAHKGGIWSIAIASDSSTIATASHENTVKFWSRQGKLLSVPMEVF
ncbi:hypothetical protein [Nostoc paludosum]|uniref:hypothetical protein n=1 Tax=Nostoc paludosum TaxID=212362 RepID=UPI0036F39DA6